MSVSSFSHRPVPVSVPLDNWNQTCRTTTSSDIMNPNTHEAQATRPLTSSTLIHNPAVDCHDPLGGKLHCVSSQLVHCTRWGHMVTGLGQSPSHDRGLQPPAALWGLAFVATRLSPHCIRHLGHSHGVRSCAIIQRVNLFSWGAPNTTTLPGDSVSAATARNASPSGTITASSLW